jgi:NDP-sugar pyrophosphorylase family protein
MPLFKRFASASFPTVLGDNLGDLSLTGIIALHRSREAAATIAMAQRSDISQSGVAEQNDETGSLASSRNRSVVRGFGH